MTRPFGLLPHDEVQQYGDAGQDKAAEQNWKNESHGSPYLTRGGGPPPVPPDRNGQDECRCQDDDTEILRERHVKGNGFGVSPQHLVQKTVHAVTKHERETITEPTRIS